MRKIKQGQVYQVNYHGTTRDVECLVVVTKPPIKHPSLCEECFYGKVIDISETDTSRNAPCTGFIGRIFMFGVSNIICRRRGAE